MRSTGRSRPRRPARKRSVAGAASARPDHHRLPHAANEWARADCAGARAPDPFANHFDHRLQLARALRRRANGLGVDHYLTKPVPLTLLRRIATARSMQRRRLKMIANPPYAEMMMWAWRAISPPSPLLFERYVVVAGTPWPSAR